MVRIADKQTRATDGPTADCSWPTQAARWLRQDPHGSGVAHPGNGPAGAGARTGCLPGRLQAARHRPGAQGHRIAAYRNQAGRRQRLPGRLQHQVHQRWSSWPARGWREASRASADDMSTRLLVPRST
eukprot:2059515-Alexandrium_andersonii.AAC.1